MSPGRMFSDDVIRQSFLYLAARVVTTGTMARNALSLWRGPLALLSAGIFISSFITCHTQRTLKSDKLCNLQSCLYFRFKTLCHCLSISWPTMVLFAGKNV